MQVYTGPKAIMAEAELSQWFHVTGVAAKAYLAPILEPFQAKYPELHLNGWVDDFGFDGSHHNAALAIQVTEAWKELSAGLQAAGLKVNNKKAVHCYRQADKAGPEPTSRSG